MNYASANSDLATLRSPCLATSLATAKRLAKATGNTATLSRAITDFKDQAGTSLRVNLDGPVARVLILGGADECSPSQYRKMSTLLAQQLAAMKIAQGGRAPAKHQGQRPQHCMESADTDAGHQPRQLPL
jgi:hypothetical protein